MIQCRVDHGVAKFGAGQTLVLTAEQINPRRHNLDVPKDWDGKQPAEVRSTAPLDFKAGEVVGVPEVERRLDGVLVPLDGQPARVAKPAAPPVNIKGEPKPAPRRSHG